MTCPPAPTSRRRTSCARLGLGLGLANPNPNPNPHPNPNPNPNPNPKQFAFSLEPWIATLILVAAWLAFRFATFALLRRKLAAALHVQQVDAPTSSPTSTASTPTSAAAPAVLAVEVREEDDMKQAEAV